MTRTRKTHRRVLYRHALDIYGTPGYLFDPHPLCGVRPPAGVLYAKRGDQPTCARCRRALGLPPIAADNHTKGDA